MLSRRLPSERTPNAWASAIEARHAAGGALIDLTEANPTRVGLSGLGEEALAALAAGATEAARYQPDPRGLASARGAVTELYAARGIAIDPDQVVITSGTSESYAHLFRLLADPGARVLTPAPSYPLFEPIARLEGLSVSSYRLAWDGTWHLDRGSLERAATGDARALIVVQPNHPTGSCLDPGEIAAIETLCAQEGMALIADEVFAEFGWPPAPAALPMLAGRDAVLTFGLGGISKLCGLPQLKLGWIVVSGPEAARREALAGLEWIADLFLSVASPVQAALPRLLSARHAWQARVRERLAANLASLEALTRRHPVLTLARGVGGWVIPLRVPGPADAEAWALALLERDVVVHPGHFYDFAYEGYLVLSLLVAPRDFERGLERFEALLADAERAGGLPAADPARDRLRR